MDELTYTVPGMSCAHCVQAVRTEVEALGGVESAAVDLDTKRVVVRGPDLDDTAIRAAIDEAGYNAA
jgi:copper chaperone